MLRLVRLVGRLPLVQSLSDLITYRIPPQIVKGIDRFEPEVIYSFLGGNVFMKLCLDVASRHAIPIVPHFMDDWPTTLYSGSPFRDRLRRSLQERLTAVLGLAPLRLTISDEMAEEYTRRYGGRFLAFMKAIEPDVLAAPPPAPPVRPVLRLVYAGGLHLDRWRSLADIGTALERLLAEGIAAQLVVHTTARFSAEADRLARPPVVNIGASLLPDEVMPAFENADIVVHVESFAPDRRVYTRFSISTKIPECMAAARPILAYGPGEVASVRYVRESGAGIAVGQRNVDDLAQALRQLATSPELRTSLGRRGREVAEVSHNAVAVREAFRRALTEAANCRIE